MTYLVAIVGLLILILLHEAGHFLVALGVGMRPRKFYVGFPPAIAKVRRNGIEYGLGAIPLGGYVRIPGMHRPAAKDADLNFGPAAREAPELAPLVAQMEVALQDGDHPAARRLLGPLRSAVDEAPLSRVALRSAERGLRDLDESLGSDAYWRQPTWKRVAVILAGPAANVAIAVALLAFVYTIGAPTSQPSRKVGEVESGKPAAVAGLRAGDEIVAVNGRRAATFDAIRDRIAATHGGTVTVTVVRGGRTLTLPPTHTVRDGDRWIFGFIPSATLRSYPVGTSVGKAFGDCWQAVRGMGVAVGGIFHQTEQNHISSAVGIVRVSNAALKLGFRLYLQILAFISLSLAVLNLLPLLPLDGGHILFSLIEGVRRRAVAREVYERASVIGFALILMLAVLGFSNDFHWTSPG